MPPDIITMPSSPLGPAPPGSQPGKTANGPPGIDPGHALFATLLAQSSVAPGTLPPGKPSVRPAALLSRKLGISQKAGVYQKSGASYKIGASQKKLGNTKTMDTLAVRSFLPTEKDAVGGELLPQTQADVPASSSQNLTAQRLTLTDLMSAVPLSVLPVSIPANGLPVSGLLSTLGHVPISTAADPTAVIRGTSPLSVERLTQSASIDTPLQSGHSGLLLPSTLPSLELPRTFAVVPAVAPVVLTPLGHSLTPASLTAGLPVTVRASPSLSESSAADISASANSVSANSVSANSVNANSVNANVKATGVLKPTGTLAVSAKTNASDAASVSIVSMSTASHPPMALPAAPNPALSLPAASLPEILAPALPKEAVADTTSKKNPGASSQNSLKSAVFPADNQTVKNTDRTNTRVAQSSSEKNPTAFPAAALGKLRAKDVSVPASAAKHSVGQDGKDALPEVSAGNSVATPAAGSAKAEAAPLTATERAAVVKQTVDGLGSLPLPKASGASEQITLQLHPKDWGSLHISVTLTPGGEAGAAKTVTAHIVADTPQVKAALESQSGELHQALRESGLHLEHFTVSVRPETVQSAAETARTGTSTSNGQSQDAGSRGFGQTSDQRPPDQKTPEQRPFDLASGAPSNGGSSAAFTGGSQQGRQEYASAQVPTAVAPPADLEPAAASAGQRVSHPGMGHFDTQA